MSVDVGRGQAEADTAASVLVSRQPIFERNGRVVGYELLVGATAQHAHDSGAATSRLLIDALGTVGLEELTGDLPAYITFSRDFLLEVGPPPIRPDLVVVQVDPAELDATLTSTLLELAGRGYALALEADDSESVPRELLERTSVGVLRVDRLEASVFAQRTAALKDQSVIVLARGVQTTEDYGRCEATGCERFQGDYYALPSVVPGRRVPTERISALGTALQLQDRDVTLERLVTIVSRDVGLSVALLRYANSAYFSLRTQVQSVKQAATLLGERPLKRWALMLALTGGTSAPKEVAQLALIRGRTCEVAGDRIPDVDSDELFTVGLLSVAAALLGAPLVDVIGPMPLFDSTKAALLEHAGPAGGLLLAVKHYEQGEFALAAASFADALALRDAYLEALRWAPRILAATAV